MMLGLATLSLGHCRRNNTGARSFLAARHECGANACLLQQSRGFARQTDRGPASSRATDRGRRWETCWRPAAPTCNSWRIANCRPICAKGGASDLVQETFLDGYRNFGRFQGDTEAELLAWLRGILLNNLAIFDRRYRRTAKRKVACERPLESLLRPSHGEVPVTAATLSPSGYAVVREEAQALEQAVARLPLDCGRIIVLVHREHLSLAEAARAMNRSIDAARRLWWCAAELLADELDETHGCR